MDYWHIYVHDFRMEAAVEKRCSSCDSIRPSGMDLYYTGLPDARYELETLLFFFFFFSAYYGLFGGATCGVTVWNWLRAFIIYTVLLIKKKKCEKSSVASAALSVALCGLPLRSRSLRAEDRIQNQEQRSRLCCSITRITLWIAADNLLQTFHRKIASNIVSFEVLLISRINCNTVLCCVSAWSDMSIKTFDIRRVV